MKLQERVRLDPRLSTHAESIVLSRFRVTQQSPATGDLQHRHRPQNFTLIVVGADPPLWTPCLFLSDTKYV